MVRPSGPSSTFTSVTVPLSSSAARPSSAKMREAPASAIITMVSCWETWPIGFTNERDSVSSEIERAQGERACTGQSEVAPVRETLRTAEMASRM